MDRVNAYKLSDYTKNGRNPEMKEETKESETTTDETATTGDNSAVGESEDFMVLNRNYEKDDNNGISNGSTYINPQEHIDIFADTALDSQNFWVQTACEITRRGNYSAKQIPNF